MKKVSTGIIAIAVIIFAVLISSCRKQMNGPLPPPTPISSPTPVPTATPLPTPFTTTYDFENSLDGWALGGDPAFTGASDVPASSVPGGTVPSGSYCAAITCNFPTTGGTIVGEYVVNPSPNNFISETSITAHVYVPAALPAQYSVQVFILDNGTTGANDYAFCSYNDTGLTYGAWNTITLNLSTCASYSQTGLNAVDAVAVQVLQNGGAAWSGTIYIDDVVVQ